MFVCLQDNTRPRNDIDNRAGKVPLVKLFVGGREKCSLILEKYLMCKRKFPSAVQLRKQIIVWKIFAQILRAIIC